MSPGSKPRWATRRPPHRMKTSITPGSVDGATTACTPSALITALEQPHPLYAGDEVPQPGRRLELEPGRQPLPLPD